MRIPDDIPLATYIKRLIAADEIMKFYLTDDWKELRQKVLEECHNECQECLKSGKVTQAKIVHHVNELKHRPDLALSEFYVDHEGNVHPNLVPVCQDCHNILHERICGNEYKPQLNEERW